MKLNLLVIVCLISGGITQTAFAISTYSLSEICNKYSDDQRNCQRIPFCQLQMIPARAAGCHARIGFEYMENACTTISIENCNPVTTGCQVYGPSRAQAFCSAVRESL